MIKNIIKNRFLLTKGFKGFRKQGALLVRSLKIICKVAPFQSLLLSACIIIQGICPAINIKISAVLIDEITKSWSTGVYYNNFLYLCLTWGMTLLFADLLMPLVFFFQGNIAEKTVFRINQSIMEKANTIQGLAPFEDKSFHDDLQIIQTQAYHKPLNLIVTVVGILKDAVSILACLFLLSAIVWWISIPILMGIFINTKVFVTIHQKTWQESLGRSTSSRLMNYFFSVFVNPSYAKELRLFKIGFYLMGRYKEIFQATYAKMYKMRLIQIIWPILPLVLSLVAILSAFIVVVLKSAHRTFGLGSIALFLQSLNNLYLGVSSFGEQAGWVKGHLLFFEKFFEFLEYKEEGLEIVRKTAVPMIFNDNIDISFKNVSFVYPDGRKALNEVSFDLKAGEKLAIVGANGAGKTSLIKLICGFYRPTSGNLMINGTSIESVDIKRWRENIAPVFQDYCEYALSLEKNVTMGIGNDSERLIKVLSEVKLNYLIPELLKGVNHTLSKAFGGTDLSGGQWQKIALARAFYKNSPLYIFDEPTAALDPLSENEILKQFSSAAIGKTVIYVTHRLGAVGLADKVLLLDKGSVVGFGAHANLLKNSCLYQDMFKVYRNYYRDLMN